MNIRNIAFLLVAPLLTFFSVTFWMTTPVYAATAVDLLSTKNFAVFAKTAVTDVPTSEITGDVGLSDGASITGLTCSEVTGTIYDGDGGYTGGGTCYVTDAAKLTTAETDLVTASNDASGRTPTTTFVAADNQLGGKTLTPGVYAFGGATTAHLTGTLVLDGQGDPNAVWIFQASSDLITASNSVMSLINAAQACNVFWVVSTQTTLGSDSTFIGTIMSGSSVVLETDAVLYGAAMSRTAAVTLDSNTISVQYCAAVTTTATTTSVGSSIGDNSTPVSYCPPIEPGVVAPSIIDSERIDADSIYISWGPYSGTNDFIVEYGTTKDNLIYNVNVTGFSTTLNGLPANQPIWVRVAARNECMVGTFEAAVLVGRITLVGAPRLPDTGFGGDSSRLWMIFTGLLSGYGVFQFILRIRKNSSE